MIKFYKYFLFLAIVFSCYASISAQPVSQSSLIKNVSSLPSPNTCNASDKNQKLIFVTGDKIYKCVSGTYVSAEGAGAANDSAVLAAKQTKHLADYSNLLSSAASAIGSVTDTPLEISAPTTVSASTLIPKNIRLKITGTGSITIAAGQTLTIENGLGFDAPKDKAIFLGAGAVYFSKSLPSFVTLEQFGAIGDGVADDLPAFNKIIASFNAPPPSGVMRIQLTSGRNYYISDRWEIDAPVEVYAAGRNRGAKITAQKGGIVIHHDGTKTGVSNGKTATYSIFRGINLVGNNNSNVDTAVTTTHTVNVAGLTVTKTSGADFTTIEDVAEGQTITINGFTYAITSRTDATHLQIQQPRLWLAVANGFPKVSWLSYGKLPLTGEWNGRTIAIGGVNYTIASVSPPGQGNSFYSINLTTNYVGAAQDTVFGIVNGFATTSGLGARVNTNHGFDVRSTAVIEDCTVSSFTGNGIFARGEGVGINGTTPNANTSYISRNTLSSNAGSGIFTSGLNANQMMISNNDATDNRGYGYWEHSGLGNNYFSNHSSYNYIGSTDAVKNAANYSNFYGEYAEGSQYGWSFGLNNIVIGGNAGSGFAPENQTDFMLMVGGTLSVTNLQSIKDLNSKATNAANIIKLGGGIGASNGEESNVMLSFGAGEDLASVAGGGSNLNVQSPSYFLRYNSATKLYDLDYKSSNVSTRGDTVLSLSSGLAAGGGGKVVFPLTTPASSTETCAAGTVKFDANYIYLCTSLNNWRRSPLSAF